MSKHANMKFPEWLEWWTRQPWIVRMYYAARWRLDAKWQRFVWERGQKPPASDSEDAP